MTDYHLARRRLVEEQLLRRGLSDRNVLRAMQKVPRHLFVEEALRDRAYGDYPLPIGQGQTISQPYMVAKMTEALMLDGTEKVLEVGTGSGYQTAVLAEMAWRVISLERILDLARMARARLESLGYHRVLVRHHDGTLGWEEESPYDGIIVTAGAPSIPPSLVRQLAVGGRLVIPIGERGEQTLTRITRREEGEEREDLGGCLFVPLLGREGWPEGP